MKIYAGIGSRETPGDVLELMTRIGYRMGAEGWTLRSGGADGADTAFENGAVGNDSPMEIYLPWAGFNSNPSELTGVSDDAMALAEHFHPAWSRLSQGAKKLHGRNVYQILGRDLNTPCQLVICWTMMGQGGGGTGQALRIARAYDIPIHDLGRPEVLAAYQRRLA